MAGKAKRKPDRPPRDTRLRYVPDEDFERRCQLARGKAPATAEKAVDHLRKAGVLDSVTLDDYRPGVLRGTVEAKLGEQIVTTCAEFGRPSYCAEQIADIKRAADAYRSMAAIAAKAGLKERRAELEAEAKWLAGHLENVKDLLPFREVRPTVTWQRRKMNRIMIEVLAILRHTTHLTHHRAVKEILPGILKVANKYGAPLVKKEAGTWDRYKTLAGEAKARGFILDDTILSFRVSLFAGDDRFSPTLFEPHPTRRK